MAAGVSSPPCQAYLHHPSSATTSTSTNTDTNTSTIIISNNSNGSSSSKTATTSSSTRSASAVSSSPASISSASSSNSSSLAFLREIGHNPSPGASNSYSAAANSTSSSPASDSNSSYGLNRSRQSLLSINSASSSNSPFSTPATSPLPPHSPLDPVAETTSSSTPHSRPKQPQHHQLGTYSGRADPKAQRSGGFFSFAASALDRTQNAIATKSDSSIRHKRSLSRLSLTGDLSLPSRGHEPLPDKISRYRPASITTSSSPSSASARSPTFPQGSRLPSTPATSGPESLYSQPYSKTDATQPPPIRLPPRTNNKMHQTSSRLLRMTDDDRPFTKDFKDLFATLVVSLLPLSAHRVRLTKVEHTFLSEDAINNLGSLKFSQSNRMPDPKDPSRIVTTTTTTTFSMAKDMARSICQRFLEARLIESADGKYQQVYTMKGSVWQLTPKGIAILDQFCSKNGIQQKQVAELIGTTSPTLVSLERDNTTDKLQTDRATMEVVFRRFVGISGFNIKNNVNTADSDSLTDYRDGFTGVKMAAERKVGGKTFRETFTGKAATDWLMDCSTTVDRRETVEIAGYFVEYELMECIQQDRAYAAQYPGSQMFQPTKHSIYQLTSRGKDLINGAAIPRGRTSEHEPQPREIRVNEKLPRDSNTQRLEKILGDPALRLLFRENLRETHCEENLSFYIDVDEFVKSCKTAIRQAQKNPSTTSMDGIKEIMAQAYGIYNAFLAPGSPCELNIDHQLRSNLATRMTKAVGQDVAMIDTLHEVTALFEDAQNAVFKLMASDSVPKFLRTQKYEQILKNYDFDTIQFTPGKLDRSQSRSNRK